MSNLSMVMPGLEACTSFLEDSDEANVSIVNNVNTPEAIEEEVEAAEVQDEVSPIEADARATEATAEVAEMYYSMIENDIAYLQEHGYDQSFYKLAIQSGRYDRIPEMQRLKGAGLESVNVTGNAHDQSTQIALEGLGSALKTAWDWIVKSCKKVMNWLKSFGNFVANIFRSNESKIGHLKQALKDRKMRTDTKDVNAKVFTTTKVKSEKANVDKLIGEYTRTVYPLTKIVNEIDRMNNQIDRGTGAVNNFDEASKESRKKVFDAVGELRKSIKETNVELKSLVAKDCTDAINAAEDALKTINNVEALRKVSTDLAKTLDNLASKEARMNDPKSSKVNAARKATKEMLGTNSATATYVGACKMVMQAFMGLASKFLKHMTIPS